MHRRHFLHTTAVATLASTLAAIPAVAQGKRKPRILLRNGWQSINIGDIAHYLGMLELFKAHGIDADVRFWSSNMENGAAELFQKEFPDVPFFLNDKDLIAKAFEECDFLLHGSGSGFVAYKDVMRWVKETGKPFGVIGISLTTINDDVISTLNKADFVYFRDGVSAQKAAEAGVKSPPHMGWGPDTAFGILKLRNDEKALAFLKENQLEEGKFLCCIPRYRWTPFWLVKKGRPFEQFKQDRNDEMKEHDHAPYREAIIQVVRQTDMKVLITCEDQTQIPLGKEMVYDPLPDDVKQKVVWRDHYWLTDEALSVYVRSAGLFGNEMHSPIMCIANGIPAIVGRWDEQTNKGFMWRDIGLDEWLFTMDDEERVAKIPETILAIAKDPAAAKARALKARDIVLAKQKEQFDNLKKSLAALPTA
jgi:polysaccharide pyruvyl transferase WcaK-like protein